MTTITEKRIVRQEWYETETTKTGWDSNGWFFDDDGFAMPENWTISQHIHFDKFGNPILGVAEKEINIA
jgi:hypothetical protein